MEAFASRIGRTESLKGRTRPSVPSSGHTGQYNLTMRIRTRRFPGPTDALSAEELS